MMDPTRVLQLVVAVVLASALSLPALAQTKGDVTNDGAFTPLDILLLGRYLDGELTAGEIPALSNADVAPVSNPDGIVDGNDLGVLMRQAVDGDLDADGLPTWFEAEFDLDPWDATSVHSLVNDAVLDLDADGMTSLEELAAGTDPRDLDSDDDGMRDRYEVEHGLDPFSNDRNDDPDEDGIRNYDEYLFGSAADSKDVDQDGIEDDDEMLFGTDPRSNDSDSDGITDAAELFIGDITDPRIPDVDDDGDGVVNALDPCPYVSNGTTDGDSDGFPDECDRCPGVDDADPVVGDPDWDGVCGAADLCPTWPSLANDASTCLCGDLDGSGTVDAIDFGLYASYAGGDQAAFWTFDAPHVCDLDGDGLCTPADAAVAAAAGGDPAQLPAAGSCSDYTVVVEHVLNRSGAGGDARLREQIWTRVWFETNRDKDDDPTNDLDPPNFNGATAWIAQQLDAPPSDEAVAVKLKPYRRDDDGVVLFPVLGETPAQLNALYYGGGSLDTNLRISRDLAEMKILRHAYTRRPLEETLLDLMFNHLNIFAAKNTNGTRYGVQEYEDQLRAALWGPYEDLIQASLEGIAMLYYLDQTTNKDTSPNENYPRELLELHTLGDGNYSETDIASVTSILSGWEALVYNRYAFGFPNQEWSSRFDSNDHASYDEANPMIVMLGGTTEYHFYDSTDGVKVVNGGATTGYVCDEPENADDGARLVCLLTQQATAKALLTGKLASRFVAESAPGGAAAAGVTAYDANGGSMKETLRAILLHDEFFDAAHLRDKIKRPHVFAASALRAIGHHSEGTSATRRGGVTSGDPDRWTFSFHGVPGELSKMGEQLYWSPPPTGFAEASSKWMSPGGMLLRWNLARTLVEARAAALPPISQEWEIDGAATDDEILAAVEARLMPAGLRPATRDRILGLTAGEPIEGTLADPDLTTVDDKVAHAAMLVLSMPEFLAY